MTENQINRYENTEPSPSGWAVISLISGIANFLGIWFLGAVVARITGYVAKNEIDKSNGSIGGERLANTGIILGWVGIGLSILMLCLTLLVILGVIGGSIALCGPFSNMINQIP